MNGFPKGDKMVEHPWTDHENLNQADKNGTIFQSNGEMSGGGKPYKMELVWRNVLLLGYAHLGAMYGFFLILSGQIKLVTFIFSFLYIIVCGMGVTAGSHRLWAHKAYKATLPLRVILVVLQTATMQNSILVWCRDHRVHHKYTETHADPHNATRGFFFAHMGWLLVKKHPDVLDKGKTVDMSDLTSDPLLRFQDKYFKILAPIASIFVPTLLAGWLFGETVIAAYHVAGLSRYISSLHGTWTVNSFAHIYGSHPYDKSIHPAENGFVSWVALGEGWHNYHHTFPWDYRTSELSSVKHNLTTYFIDFFARLGWAYDLKTVPEEVMRKRVQRTGDGSYVKPPESWDLGKSGHIEGGPWGWGDPDTPQGSIKLTSILHPRKEG